MGCSLSENGTFGRPEAVLGENGTGYQKTGHMVTLGIDVPGASFSVRMELKYFLKNNTIPLALVTKIGTIQRRSAWPLRKDDTQDRDDWPTLDVGY
ncbi:hypothetical protein AVEN_267329-1 [Araneus ventricosus]|uniref:Uncharacterized protein n=1 Tax=Araneus ventricosus TaxID=182803 RepID=A0A4Y2DL65_ARAVE|nr:hypothetical protein AVEN_267329-1 [Araneus ventricosus]